MFDKRTAYTILDEDRFKTTITLPKIVSDTLQKEVNDVHALIQGFYNKVANKLPKLSRRKKGNVVRLLSEAKAQKSIHYIEFINIYL